MVSMMETFELKLLSFFMPVNLTIHDAQYYTREERKVKVKPQVKIIA